LRYAPSTDPFQLPSRAVSLTSPQLHQKIASHFDKDYDIIKYRNLCRTSFQAIDADGYSFWRRRFLEVFETPGWKLTGHRLNDNEKFRDEYTKRKLVLLKRPKFKKGNDEVEKVCLELLRQLVVGECLSGG